MKITVVIIDDHKLIRQMWRQMLAIDPAIEVVGDTGTLKEGIELTVTKRPDIVLLDINLGLESGFDAVPHIRRATPGTKIIVVSMHTQPSYAKKMLQTGVKAYITKNSSSEEMIEAINEVMKGNTYMCAEIKDIIAEQVINADMSQPDIKSLSLREIEIIKLIKDGLSSKEISARLSIGLRTAEVHRYNILKKLKLKNAAALINFVNSTDLHFI